MNRYEVKVRTDKTLIVEADSKEEAEKVALEESDMYRGLSFMQSVVGIKDLTGDPYSLLTELAMQLEAITFGHNKCCKYCAAPQQNYHSADCIIERARYCVERHRRKADEDHTD